MSSITRKQVSETINVCEHQACPNSDVKVAINSKYRLIDLVAEIMQIVYGMIVFRSDLNF